MNGPVLTLLAAIIAALLMLGALGAVWRRRAREIIGFGGATLTGLAAILALLSLLLDDPSVQITLPLGPPGAAFRLGLDPLSACFALLLFLPGALSLAFVAESRKAADTGALVWQPVALAGLGLAVLASDGVALACGLIVGGASVWALAAAESRRAGATQLAVILAAAAATIAASSLLGPSGAVADFATIRASTAEPPQAGVLLLTLLGPGGLAGLVPLHRWLVTVHRGASSAGATMVSGAIVPVAIYVMIRLLLDLPGAAPPAWWSVVLLGLGALSVVLGGLDATREPDISTVLAAGSVRQVGLAAIGLGTALAARSADLPGVVALSLGAVLLLAALQACGGTLVGLAAGAIRRATATPRLDGLGGLVHHMPFSTACLTAGLFGSAVLPPAGGFAAVWLLLQTLLAMPRSGALASSLLFAVQAALLGLAAALSTAAALRLIGVACLGRPRMPRTEGAEEIARPARIPLLLLASLVLGLGIFPGPSVRLLANGALRALTGGGLGPHASPVGLAPAAAAPGYAALPLVLLLLLSSGLIFWLRRRRAHVAAAPSGRAWDGGFAAPFARMHFADPTTQTAGAGFTPFPPGPRWPNLISTRTLPRFRMRLAAPAITLVALAAWLTLCAWIGTT